MHNLVCAGCIWASRQIWFETLQSCISEEINVLVLKGSWREEKRGEEAGSGREDADGVELNDSEEEMMDIF